MFWVICYDIPDNRRRRLVQKIMEGHGRRVQYSVFECDLNPARLDRLEGKLLKVIDPEEDDVRFYPLNQANLQRIRLLGKATLDLPKGHHII